MTTTTSTQNRTAQPVAGTASFSKFMRVLDAIAGNTGAGVTIQDLSVCVGYPKPTLYRIVDALLAEGLIMNKGGQLFGLGPRLISLASQALESSDLRKVCREQLMALRDQTSETIHLAVPVNGAMTYIDKIESPQAVRMNSRLGSQVTFYSSSVGKAYLAALPDEAQRRTLIDGITFQKFTDNTLPSVQALYQELQDIEQQGFSEDRQENERDIFCYGCAIVDKNARPVACVSISIPLFRIAADRRQTYIEPLLNACKAISQKLRLLDIEA
ncbi:IclR family transcriptional regulator [Advenella sp. S44]|uniref:IclR family transcriptional regulator n=1 Tax=Advenella sp. S44 TaxID=1982755 RepID=UPI000C2B0A44|nr:IclR family transcriptional regulator [Advenella sp. S44]PJX20503.1 IclR family transcriptional regulator [Advenella sp. S44]